MKKRAKKVSLDSRILEKLVSPYRLKILRILKTTPKINQSDLRRQLGVSYRQTQRYVKSLEDLKIIKKKKLKKAIGSPVFISLNTLSKGL